MKITALFKNEIDIKIQEAINSLKPEGVDLVSLNQLSKKTGLNYPFLLRYIEKSNKFKLVILGGRFKFVKIASVGGINAGESEKTNIA